MDSIVQPIPNILPCQPTIVALHYIAAPALTGLRAWVVTCISHSCCEILIGALNRLIYNGSKDKMAATPS